MVRLMNRMGPHSKVGNFLSKKIERRNAFLAEIESTIEHDLVVENSLLIQRPIALYWLKEDLLLNVPSQNSAFEIIRHADIKSYEEYGYLLKSFNIPECAKILATRHRKILHEEVLIDPLN